MKIDKAVELINEVELVEILKNLIRIPGHVNYDFQEKATSEYVVNILKKENILKLCLIWLLFRVKWDEDD